VDDSTAVDYIIDEYSLSKFQLTPQLPLNLTHYYGVLVYTERPVGVVAVLPVLWMTSCFHATAIRRVFLQAAIEHDKFSSRDYNCILLNDIVIVVNCAPEAKFVIYHCLHVL